MRNTQETDVSALCIDVSKVKPLSGQSRKSDCHNAHNAEAGGWTVVLMVAGATCCLGSALPAGYNIGVMNNPANLIQSFCERSIKEKHNVQLSDYQLQILWSAIVSVFLIGGVSGSLIGSWLSDRFGRKIALGVGNVCGIVGGVLFLLVRPVNSVELLLLGRVFAGLSGGLATCLLPMYMTEIAPLKLRGAVGVLCQLGITCGVLLGQIDGLENVLGNPEYWHIMLGSFTPLCLVGLLITIFLPESPKYLYIIKGKQGKALKELSRLRNMSITMLQNEIDSLQHELAAKSTSETWSIKRVLREPTVRLPLILVCAMQFGQQLSGINAVFYYSKLLFMHAGLAKDDAEYAVLGTGIANIVMAVLSTVIMSMFSRRKVFLLSCYLCIGCLVILCISLSIINSSPLMPWLSTIMVLAYVVFYGIGLGPIPFFIGSELFDVGPRPAAMSLGSVFNWGGNFLVGMMFTSLHSAIGPFVFLFFAGCTLLLVLLNQYV